jgi:hypothetical protein
MSDVTLDYRRKRPRAARHIVTLTTLAALGIGAAAAFELGASAVPAAATSSTTCAPVNIVVNSGGGVGNVLNTYTPTGSLVSSVGLTNTYSEGDIAYNATGTVLYGVQYHGAYGAIIDTINPATGAVISSVTATGPAGTGTGPYNYYFNGLSGLPNGDLLAGTYEGPTLYEINPTNGVSTVYSLSLPSNQWSAGDFLPISGGDILALASAPGSITYLERLHSDGTVTILGTVPSSYGMTQSAGSIYLAGADGVIRQLASVPTVASVSPLTLTSVVSTGLALYGATSVQDSGNCNTPALPPSAPTAVSASPGVASATVTFGPPQTDNGASVTGYTASAVDLTSAARGGQTARGAAGPLTVTGLTPGDSYEFTVTATNSAGTSVASVASAAVSPAAPFDLNSRLIAVLPGGNGYWITSSTGNVLNFGAAPSYGTLAGTALHAPIVGIAATPDGLGYWLVGADGGVFAFGDAGFYGSTGGQHLNQPIVGMAATPTGSGYWLVASDGGIFTFGDAGFYGSTGGQHLNQPIVGMAATPTGSGYWLVASDGGIFTFGSAAFYGSMGGKPLNAPVVGMAATPTGSGYWLVASDGGVFTFGSAAFYGSMGGKHLNKPMDGMQATSDGFGYWAVAQDGGVFAFGDAGFIGSAPGTGTTFIG